MNFQEQQSADMDLNLEAMTHNCALSDTEKEHLLLNASNRQKSPIPPSMSNGDVSTRFIFAFVLYFVL